MDDTQELSPRTDTTDDVSEYNGSSSEDDEPRATSTTSETSGYSGSDDDGCPSDEFFSDDECSADPPFVEPKCPSEEFFSGDECSADPPFVEPPPVEAPRLYLMPGCLKCSQRLVPLLENMQTAHRIEFDEHGVAVLPKVAGSRDRGTVTIKLDCRCPTIKLDCSCPKVTDFSFSQADYQSLFV